MKLKKLNIMKTRPDISDAEIQSLMDFDKVLQRHASPSRSPLWRSEAGGRRWRYLPIIAISTVLSLVLVTAWFFIQPGEEKAPVVTKAPEPKKDVQPVEIVPQKPAEVIVKKQKPDISQPKETPTDVYIEAEPVNGYDDLYAYFEKELKYPVEVAVAAEGDVEVTFVINREGKPEHIKFVNSLGPEFDKEVIRVINNMPGWKPAMQNGKPVPARISQSFTFSIKSKGL